MNQWSLYMKKTDSLCRLNIRYQLYIVGFQMNPARQTDTLNPAQVQSSAKAHVAST